ncbi:hypothetical protein Q31a_57400 [Aureliella helgolandensis]|uniref:Uncharacterized protein n=1 Tax=Aureliella helgolandensis TaxID=2527968 RepID=A0A518GFH0_9BACT|nr:hypothetical protein Q31a_57400 [Aureliella helgolandensis]
MWPGLSEKQSRELTHNPSFVGRFEPPHPGPLPQSTWGEGGSNLCRFDPVTMPKLPIGIHDRQPPRAVAAPSLPTRLGDGLRFQSYREGTVPKHLAANRFSATAAHS